MGLPNREHPAPTARRSTAGARAEIPVIDPCDGHEITTVPNASVDDALVAARAAAAALPAWSATAPRERSDVLHRAFMLMLERRDELASLIVRENGKPLADAHAEVTYAAEYVRWYAEQGVRLNGTIGPSPDGTMNMLVLHQPIGVALLVTPWNLPLAMVTRKVAPALAVGCTALLKPSESTPLSALRFAEILAEAGAPTGTVNVLPTLDSREVVGALLADDAVRKLSFTGSTPVGRLLLQSAASRVVSCSMELGGNAPLIVFEDADLDLAVTATLTAKMRHNGEACTAANRLYVHRKVRGEFVDRLTAGMAALAVGPGMAPGTQLGPLIDARARDGVAGLVATAVADGARVRLGAEVPTGPGFFYPATVLDDVAPDAALLGAEVFGPVAPVVEFGGDDDLMAMANRTEHGLMSYVFTRDLARAMRTAEALESGMVAVNRGVISDPAAPFGGVKQSGLGREGGQDGLLEYTEPKYIGVSW